MPEEMMSPLDFTRRTYVDYFLESYRYLAAKEIARVCRDTCKNLPLGDKVRCFRSCFGDKEALLVADFRRALETILYPLVVDYPLVVEMVVDYEDYRVEAYDPVYGSLT